MDSARFTFSRVLYEGVVVMDEPLHVAIGIVWSGTRLLVGRRQPGSALAGFEEFPGGKCRPKEQPAAAVVRECREETGLDVKVIAQRAHVDHRYAHGQLSLWYFDCAPVEAAGPSSHSVCGVPHSPFRWAELDEIFQLRFPDANREVLDSLRRTPGPLFDRPAHP